MTDYSDIFTKLSAVVVDSVGKLKFQSNGGIDSSKNDVTIVIGTATLLTLMATQLLTEADPVGRCYRFWRQLANQVRTEGMCKHTYIQINLDKEIFL